MNFFFLSLFLAATQTAALTDDTDTLLMQPGKNIQTMVINGKLSASGSQSLQGMPFHVEMDSMGSYLLTMGGPFGITAAKMYATADTFVMVNYLMQEVWHGNPDSPSLRSATHLPLPASQLMMLLRGRVPGSIARFSRTRKDGQGALYSASDSAGVEYVLIDTVQQILQQYQRKDSSGALVLDVAFQDVQAIDGLPLPHRLLIRSGTSGQEATVSITDAVVNHALPKPLTLSVPETFERRYFH
ncbi:MAG: DUF4292 domain-containing protein [Bradyrhizobiaceae bacterium]|nr:DUF4292 domain-containing protein [Bradyrhizobiaceae bacterium]